MDSAELLKEYHEFVYDLANCDIARIDGGIIHAAFGIASEAGEIMTAIKKHVAYRAELDIDNIIEESGDLMFFIVFLLNRLDISIDDVLKANMKKLRKRYPNGYSDKDALDRKDKNS